MANQCFSIIYSFYFSHYANILGVLGEQRKTDSSDYPAAQGNMVQMETE